MADMPQSDTPESSAGHFRNAYNSTYHQLKETHQKLMVAQSACKIAIFWAVSMTILSGLIVGVTIMEG